MLKVAQAAALISLATTSYSYANNSYFDDLPALDKERVVCAITAAQKYKIPSNVLLAVAEKEGGKPGQWVRNSNGTYDVGSMQINTVFLKDLAEYNITADDVAAQGCYPFELAAWRIHNHLKKDKGDTWTKAANYHSKTPKYNAIYRADLIAKAAKWESWLNKHFLTNADYQAVVLKETPKEKRVTQQTVITRPTIKYVPRQITFSGKN